MTLSEGPGGVVVGVEVVDGVAEIVVGAAEVGAAVLDPLPTGGVYCLVGGAVQVVVALVVVVDGGGGAGAAVVGAVVGALEGAGGAGAGVVAVVAGAGCWFCGDWLAPPTRITVETMIMNAATTVAPMIVRPASVLNHLVPALG
jgi:hypothetical protein